MEEKKMFEYYERCIENAKTMEALDSSVKEILNLYELGILDGIDIEFLFDKAAKKKIEIFHFLDSRENVVIFNYFIKEKKIDDRKARDYIEVAKELNALTLDTLYFLFGESGGVEINDGFIVEV